MKNQQKLKNGIIKIIQITDTHLFGNDNDLIQGIKSNLKFAEVINKIIDTEISNTDMIFLTGDISQDETEKSYQKAVYFLEKLNIPIYWIPGNHDNFYLMQSIFNYSNNFRYTDSLLISNWEFIFINTKDDYIIKPELEKIKNKIIHVKDKKIALVMHHHPAEVQTPLVDYYILKNRDEFWECISNTNVELIICGHVHGDYSLKYNGIFIESGPATCLQWSKGTKEIKIDPKIGYKTYYFQKDQYNAISTLW